MIGPSQVSQQVSMKIRGNVTLEVKLVKIIVWGEMKLQNKVVLLVRMMWRNSGRKGDLKKRVENEKEVSGPNFGR